MTNRRPAETFPPGEFIRDELAERGWTQSDLAKIMGRPLPAINGIINSNRSITTETAIELASALGTSPEFWLNLETAYQLSKANVAEENAIRQRAKLFESAPVKDMEKRGWIKPANNIIALDTSLNQFFSIPEASKLRVAARTSIQSSELNPEQIAWCVRALQLAKALPAQRFTRKRE